MAIITVSRGSFSGGQKLAECVAANLGYRCVSREILVNAAKEYGVSAEKLSQALTNEPKIWEHIILERKKYLSFIKSALIREVRDENVVYHGHAGHLLLNGVPHVLRVRVIASMAFRTEAAMERRGLSREEAIKFIEKIDAKRVKWTRFLYRVDWNDPSLYDIVINLDHITLNGACEMVSHMAGWNEYKPSKLSKKAIDDLALSTHLKALITGDKLVSDGHVEIIADDGVVTIAGVVESIGEADRIRVIVRNAPGVKYVDSRLRARLPSWPVGVS